MIDICDEFQVMLEQELEAIREVHEEIGCAVCGPTYVPDDEGNFGAGWMVQVLLRDSQDFYASVPIFGIDPKRETFSLTAEYLLAVLRDQRDSAEPDGAAPSFSASCVGQVGDEDGNPIGPVKFPPGYSGDTEG